MDNTRRERTGLLSGTTQDRPAVAATIMVGSLFLLGFQDALVKTTSSEVSLWQFNMVRGAFNCLLLLILMRVIWGRGNPRPLKPWSVLLRSVFQITTMCFFFGGVPFLSLAAIAAGLYVYPLFVAVLSAVVLGEHVGPRRIVAIIVGFAGTLLILKPGTDAFKLVGLMPIAAAFFYALTILTTRRLCREESPVTLAMGLAIGFTLIGGSMTILFTLHTPQHLSWQWPFLFTGWHPLEFWVVGLIAVCSLFNATSNIGLAKAYQSADASWLAPFGYSYLIFATFWGYVFWQTVPDVLTVMGMTFIAGAGTFIVWRESQEHWPRIP